MPINEQNFDFITPETPFSTRHFTVLFDKNGEVVKTFTESIYSVTEEEAVEYARKLIGGGDERGWISSYRYKVFSADKGYGVGLSMAKAIVEKHRGEITAYEKDCTHIGFKVVL